MSEVIFEQGGFKATIEVDDDPASPRDATNLGMMLAFHRRYSLGDSKAHLRRNGTDLSSISTDDFSGWNEMGAFLHNECDAAVVLPLYLYDHGGITISTSSFGCRWDSGQVGFIMAPKADVAEWYGDLSPASIERARKALEQEVKEYDRYLRGEAYIVTVHNAEGEVVERTHIIGREYAEGEGKMMVEAEVRYAAMVATAPVEVA